MVDGCVYSNIIYYFALYLEDFVNAQNFNSKWQLYVRNLWKLKFQMWKYLDKITFIFLYENQ